VVDRPAYITWDGAVPMLTVDGTAESGLLLCYAIAGAMCVRALGHKHVYGADTIASASNSLPGSSSLTWGLLYTLQIAYLGFGIPLVQHFALCVGSGPVYRVGYGLEQQYWTGLDEI